MVANYDGESRLVQTLVEDVRTGTGWLMSYSWDFLGRLTQAYTDFAGAISLEYFDDPIDSEESLRKRISWPGGMSAEYFVDSFHRSARTVHKDGSGNPLVAQEYDWDFRNELTRQEIDSHGYAQSREFAYDPSSRLVEAEFSGHPVPGGNASLSYSYDNNHNLLGVEDALHPQTNRVFQTSPSWPDRLNQVSYPNLPSAASLWLSQFPQTYTDELGRVINSPSLVQEKIHQRQMGWDAMSRLDALSVTTLNPSDPGSSPVTSASFHYYPGTSQRAGVAITSQPVRWTLLSRLQEVEGINELLASGWRSLAHPGILDERYGLLQGESWESPSVHYLSDRQNTVIAKSAPRVATGTSVPAPTLQTRAIQSPYGLPLLQPEDLGGSLPYFTFQGRSYCNPPSLRTTLN